MSEKQVVMKFELLPNEILIECFKYFDASDIFYSFDQLNYRFFKLIRTIPLHLNCQYVRKSIFDQFCTNILSTPGIKAQIRSIHLSNKNTCASIKTFLSSSSFNQFPHIRSVTLTEVWKNNVEQLKSMLSLMPELTCFRLFDSEHFTDVLLSVVPMSKLRILAVRTMDSILTSTYEILPIKNLTIYDCCLDKLCYLFQCVPMLQYLYIKYISKNESLVYANNDFTGDCAVYLKQLTINNFTEEFDDLVMLLKQTPNLKCLIISADNNKDMIDPCQWEYLITSSLSQLTIFKFHFRIYSSDDILDKFQKFQSDFWQEQHHWYIEYVFYENSAHIYTIPYISNNYMITPRTNRYPNKSISNANTFDNVSNLILYQEALTLKASYYFPKATSLSIANTIYLDDIDVDFLKIEHIHFLKMIVNLSNLKHLTISSSCKIQSSSVLLQLIKETPQLSSMDIELRDLRLFFKNNELCKYLNKAITRLDISRSRFDLSNDSDGLEQLCKIFSNLEQLICHINQDNDLLFLLIRLPKLSIMKIYLSSSSDRDCFVPWLNNQGQKLKLTIHSEFENSVTKTLSIWIDR